MAWRLSPGSKLGQSWGLTSFGPHLSGISALHCLTARPTPWIPLSPLFYLYLSVVSGVKSSHNHFPLGWKQNPSRAILRLFKIVFCAAFLRCHFIRESNLMVNFYFVAKWQFKTLLLELCSCVINLIYNHYHFSAKEFLELRKFYLQIIFKWIKLLWTLIFSHEYSCADFTVLGIYLHIYSLGFSWFGCLLVHFVYVHGLLTSSQALGIGPYCSQWIKQPCFPLWVWSGNNTTYRSFNITPIMAPELEVPFLHFPKCP